MGAASLLKDRTMLNAAFKDYSLHPATAAFLARAHGLMIDGRSVAALAGRRRDVFDPASEEAFTTVAEASPEDVDLAVAAARRAFEGDWARVTPSQRGRMLNRMAELIETNGDELAELECLNSGKPLQFCRNVDIFGVADMFRYMAGWATKITGDTHNPSMPGEWHAYTLRQPVGVVGQILPWNFPMNMAAWKIAPALAAGCTIVLKPAEATPLTALRLAELALEAGIPAGVINVVTGKGSVIGDAITNHPGIDKVAFTGSTEVGQHIARNCVSSNLKKVSLELGGKSPVIVFPDADLDAAVAGIAGSIFFHAGQVCAAGSRLYVHEKIYDRVVEAVAAKAAGLKVGPGMLPDHDLGPVISRAQRESVMAYIEKGRAEGAEVLTGGRALGAKGHFVEPTVLAGTGPGMAVHDEEIFGPVLCAMRFGDEDLDAIAARANASPYGLSSSIWTRDLSVAHRLAKRIQSGIVNVNTHTSPDASLPYGGYKQSGWGRERGAEVLDLYTQIKAVAVKLA